MNPNSHRGPIGGIDVGENSVIIVDKACAKRMRGGLYTETDHRESRLDEPAFLERSNSL